MSAFRVKRRRGRRRQRGLQQSSREEEEEVMAVKISIVYIRSRLALQDSIHRRLYII